MSTPRLALTMTPTPIQKLKKTSAALGKEIYIWRDDLNGCTESGNKLRKLEFLMADALKKGCDWIITCGGPQSNHTRATAIIARQLGLEVSVLILPRANFDPQKTPTGNLLLNQIFESQITWIKPEEFQSLNAGYEPFLTREMERVKSLGKKPYVIPLGGSNALGCLGYQSAVSEMLPLWKKVAGSHAPETLFCALGSGGTYVGLHQGILKEKLQTQLYGVNVIGPVETAQKYVSNLSSDSSLQKNIIDGYVGDGYSIASNADLQFYTQFARDEGILLDPCYTGKAFQGMVSEIKKNPSRFGNQILFLHSGGVFGSFAYADQFKEALHTMSAT